jgi:hypothetical protein
MASVVAASSEAANHTRKPFSISELFTTNLWAKTRGGRLPRRCWKEQA